jgi:hypothetical protein
MEAFMEGIMGFERMLRRRVGGAAWRRGSAVFACAATLACEQSLDPNFDPTEITVDVTIAGNGGGRVAAPDPVRINCVKSTTIPGGLGACGNTFVDAGAGGTFTLDAVADSVSTFAGWSGDCAGPVCSLSFPGRRDTTFRVTARFILQPPVATIESPIDGSSYYAGESVLFAGLATDGSGRQLRLADVWTSASSQTVTLAFAEALSVDFNGMPNQTPVVTITSPEPGSTYGPSAQIVFSATAADPEDGALTGAAVVWTSSVDGAIGTGASFSRTLSIGAHTITAAATDAAGATGAASVDITVVEPNPTASISGRITGNGFAVGDATITLTGPVSATATSDDTGNYAFTMLPAGTYTVRVSVELNINFPANPQTVTLAPGQALTVNFAGTY